jgi:hypothetical protein
MDSKSVGKSKIDDISQLIQLYMVLDVLIYRLVYKPLKGLMMQDLHILIKNFNN